MTREREGEVELTTMPPTEVTPKVPPEVPTTTPSVPPPGRRGFGLGTLALVAVASASLSAGGLWCLGRGERARADDTASKGATKGAAAPVHRYQCAMHPTVVQDHPGECPICGMELTEVHETEQPRADGGIGSATATVATEHRVLFYRSPMDPKVTSPVPTKDSMGMEFTPVYADELAGAATKVPGQAIVEIDPDRQQLIGLTTAEVSTGKVGGAWRTVGRVTVDETRVRHINLKVPGFVEHIYVDFIGKKVRKGDPLFAIYSPELMSAQEEYLLALRTRGALANTGGSPVIDGEQLVKSARRKLALWDISQAELDRIAATGEPMRTMTVHSPVSGVVTKKDVVEGMKLDAGAMPYEIIDLTSVWVLADIYETELRNVEEGMAATLTLAAFPDRAFTGTVLFIDPMLDPRTRTVKVRLAFGNPKGELRPEMFGEVLLSRKARDGLQLPRDAVIDSGIEKLVFVAVGDGKFQPRIVRLGETTGDLVEVVSGVEAGERVVTRANFLVDSESRLRASLLEMAAATAPASARVLPSTVKP